MSQDLTKNIKRMLASGGVKPSKGLGQSFLVSKMVLNKIIEVADIKPTDIILEIGPGTGILTQELAKKAEKVIAVEKDLKMVKILKETLKDYKNVKIIQADALSYEFQIPNYKIVANLPYYIASPVIRKFLEAKNQPELMVLMVQKEVSQRICAKPPRMNLLAVSIQFYGKPEIISYVPKQSFWPQPKVDSAILKISNIKKPPINVDLFFKIVKVGFSHPRKQLVGNFIKGLALPPLASLASGGSLPKELALSRSKGVKLKKSTVEYWLLQNKINLKQRAETLSVKDWGRLMKDFPLLY